MLASDKLAAAAATSIYKNADQPRRASVATSIELHQVRAARKLALEAADREESPPKSRVSFTASTADEAPTGKAMVRRKSTWNRFAETKPKLFAQMERDVRKAQKQVEREIVEEEALTKIAAVWRRARPERHEQRRERGILGLLQQEMRAHWRRQAAAMKEEEEASAQALADEMLGSIVSNALRMAQEQAEEEARLARELAAAEQNAKQREQDLQRVKEKVRVEVQEATRQRDLRAEAEDWAFDQAEVERLAAEKLAKEALAIEVGRRRRAAADLLLGMKQQSTWFSAQTVGQFSPNVVPWRAWNPKRDATDRQENSKAKAEAVVVGAFVDNCAIRPKTPVMPPRDVHVISPRHPLRITSSTSAFEAAGSGINAFLKGEAPPPGAPHTSWAAHFRRSQSAGALPPVASPSRSSIRSRGGSRGGARLGLGVSMEELRPVKGAVPFQTAGILAPMPQPRKPPALGVKVELYKGCDSVAYLSMAMAGGPSQLLPVVEIDDLRKVLEVAGVPLELWSERNLQALLAELVTLEAALFSWSHEAGRRVRLERTWNGEGGEDGEDGEDAFPLPPAREEREGAAPAKLSLEALPQQGEAEEKGTEEATLDPQEETLDQQLELAAEEGTEVSTSKKGVSAEPPLCPHLLLKRKVLCVHVLSECGRLELMERVTSKTAASCGGGDLVSGGVVYKRIMGRLTDRQPPGRAAVVMASELFGVDETRVKELDPHPLLYAEPSERCSYPGLRCQEKIYAVRLFVEDIPRQGLKLNSGEWAWVPRRDQPPGGRLPPSSPSTSTLRSTYSFSRSSTPLPSSSPPTRKTRSRFTRSPRRSPTPLLSSRDRLPLRSGVQLPMTGDRPQTGDRPWTAADSSSSWPMTAV